MAELLGKMLAFILEAMRGSPLDNETTPATVNQSKKPAMILAILICVALGLGFMWYDYKIKTVTDIFGLKDKQSQRIMADLQRANGTLKEDRIRLSAKVANITERYTDVTRDNNILKLTNEKLNDDHADILALLLEREKLILVQEHKLDKLNERLISGAKDNRLIWDEIVTLGNEGGN